MSPLKTFFVEKYAVYSIYYAVNCAGKISILSISSTLFGATSGREMIDFNYHDRHRLSMFIKYDMQRRM